MGKNGVKDEFYKIASAEACISITNRCNAACRHCIAAVEEAALIDAKYDDVMSWIEQLSECGVETVHFAGGEPFVCEKELIDYVAKVKELGMNAGVVTNGLWAKDKKKGIELLKKMPGLVYIVISTDKYHLEYINSKIVKNSIDACLEAGRFVSINVTYVEKQEVVEINKIYKDYINKIAIQPFKAMPFNGKDSKKIKRIYPFKFPKRVPRYCGIGRLYIDIDGRVDACCQASRASVTGYLNYGNMNAYKLKKLINNFKNKDIATFISKFGPRGIVEKFNETHLSNSLNDREFTSGCEVCCDLLNDPECLELFKSQINCGDNKVENE